MTECPSFSTKSVGNVRNKGPQLITPTDASLFGETV
jgi:hypothetical protein